MSRLSHAMRIPNLTTNMLLQQGPEALASASKCMSNPFWKVVLARYTQLERTFYTLNQNRLVGERVVWDNMDFLHEGKPLSRRASGSTLTHHVNTLSQFISPATNVLMTEEEASTILEGKHMPGWRNMVRSASIFLEIRNIPWVSLSRPRSGDPNHMGWSRIVCENSKSKKFYNLMMTRPPDQERNPNEAKWRRDGLRERFKKKDSKKKLTNVSFAFTHTYTLVKTNIFGIFSQACLENFEKCVKTPKKNLVHCPMFTSSC